MIGLRSFLILVRRLVFGVWCLVFGVWCLVFGVWCLVFGVWCLVFGVWCLVFGVWCLVFGVWCLVFGVWCLEPGAWSFHAGRHQILGASGCFFNSRNASCRRNTSTRSPSGRSGRLMPWAQTPSCRSMNWSRKRRTISATWRERFGISRWSDTASVTRLRAV